MDLWEVSWPEPIPDVHILLATESNFSSSSSCKTGSITSLEFPCLEYKSQCHIKYCILTSGQ